MTTTTETMTTTEWAKRNGTKFVFTAALDNYEPTRNYVNDHGWFFEQPGREGFVGIVLADATYFKNYRESVYLIDDGDTVEPYYVASWSTTERHVVLHPFPTSKVRHAKTGEPVDFGNWTLGPRTVQHLKVRRA